MRWSSLTAEPSSSACLTRDLGVTVDELHAGIPLRPARQPLSLMPPILGKRWGQGPMGL
jgi:hypothetical protein